MKTGDFLNSITALRKSLQGVSASLVEDGNRKTLYQQATLADIELEKFLFMKVSECLG